ncbi:hypothetical protein Clacol_007914 [Clathrus columnatus]|uniref:C2H2-type domain-containing protein n=1 Tax=Clathrus columnatus TaxID=1419009 RepID=A0AAV5AKP2_9AGAM|nr:hypothetical protein Clacol_007914 [Clathrus columnatus]
MPSPSSSSHCSMDKSSESPTTALFRHVLEGAGVDLASTSLPPIQGAKKTGWLERSPANANATRQVTSSAGNNQVYACGGPSRAPDNNASPDANVCSDVPNQSSCGSPNGHASIRTKPSVADVSTPEVNASLATQTAPNHGHVNTGQAISSNVSTLPNVATLDPCASPSTQPPIAKHGGVNTSTPSKSSKRNEGEMDQKDEPVKSTPHLDGPARKKTKMDLETTIDATSNNRTDCQTALPIPGAITTQGDQPLDVLIAASEDVESRPTSPSYGVGRILTQSNHSAPQNHGNLPETIPDADACSMPEPLHPPIASISEPPTTTKRKRRVIARDYYSQALDPISDNPEKESGKRVLPSDTLYYKNDAGKFVCRYVGPACTQGFSQTTADLRSLIRHLRIHARKEVRSNTTEDQWVACNGMPDEILRPMIVCSIPEEELHTCRYFREHGKRWTVKSMERWEGVIKEHQEEDHDHVPKTKKRKRKLETLVM